MKNDNKNKNTEKLKRLNEKRKNKKARKKIENLRLKYTKKSKIKSFYASKIPGWLINFMNDPSNDSLEEWASKCDPSTIPYGLLKHKHI